MISAKFRPTCHSSVTAQSVFMKLETYNYCWKTTHYDRRYFDRMMWVVWANSQFATVVFFLVFFLSLCFAQWSHCWTDFDDLYVIWRLSMHGCAFWGSVDIFFHLCSYEGRSISNAPDPLPVVWSSSNFACAMIYISMGYIMGYSSELIVVGDLQVFELSQVWNGPCWVSHSDPVFVFERTHTTEDFWWNETNLWW